MDSKKKYLKYKKKYFELQNKLIEQKIIQKGGFDDDNNIENNVNDNQDARTNELEQNIQTPQRDIQTPQGDIQTPQGDIQTPENSHSYRISRDQVRQILNYMQTTRPNVNITSNDNYNHNPYHFPNIGQNDEIYLDQSLNSNRNMEGNLINQFEDVADNNDLIDGNNLEDEFELESELESDDNVENTPIDIQTVIANINYEPYIPQQPIRLDYLTYGNDKLFDFYIESDYYNSHEKPHKTILNKSTKIYDIFEKIFTNRNIILKPNSKPFFIFIDVLTNERDEGIDAGGLTRTVFKYLSLNLSNSIFFKMDENTKLFKLNSFNEESLKKNFNKEKIYFIGQLFGLAIKLNQQIQINLEPILLYQLSHNIDIENIENISKEDILKIINDYDEKMLDELPYLCFDVDESTKTNSSNQSCFYNSDGELIQLSDIMKETIKKIKDEIIEKDLITKLFVKGFRSQINIKKSKINKLPLNLLDELIAGIKVMNFSTLLKNLNFINFDEKQKNLLIKILEFHICTSIHSEYIGLLLMVMTGSDRIPANGYPEYKKLRFEIQQHTKYNLPIDVRSCSNEFIIKKSLFDEYESYTGDKKELELFTTFSQESLKKIKVLFTAS